jgi:glycerol dehydrogenase
MKKIMISPSRYVQAAGVLGDLPHHVAELGTKGLLVASGGGAGRAGIDDSTLVKGGFQGECTKAEITRLAALARETGCDVIVGLGGGKALDSAKAVAAEHRLPVIVVPTIASTDAPCSALAVIYTEDGAFEEYRFFPRNPDLVLVDCAVIARAPARFLVAGMGDALSTWFEARACSRSNADNTRGGKSTLAGLAIAELCYRTLIADGERALRSCEAGVVTPALENVIEANTLLSGLGFESSGLAAAHSVHNGLTRLPETHGALHGEKVAFGVLVQLVLENAPSAEFDEVIGFCRRVGLPTRLSQLGITDPAAGRLMAVAEGAVAPGESIHNLPFPVTAGEVLAAILVADRIGAAD